MMTQPYVLNKQLMEATSLPDLQNLTMAMFPETMAILISGLLNQIWQEVYYGKNLQEEAIMKVPGAFSKLQMVGTLWQVILFLMMEMFQGIIRTATATILTIIGS